MLLIEHTKYRTTVKFNVKAPGLYNFIKGFVWAGGVQKNNFLCFIVPIQVFYKTRLYIRPAYIPGGRLISRIIFSLANGWV